MLLGVDISHFQNPSLIDWRAFRDQGVRFAIPRATYGVKPDQTFQEHLRKAHNAGMVIGAYHFLRYRDGQSARAQAEAFLEAMEPVSDLLQHMLPPSLDLEANAQNGDIPLTNAADRKKYRELAAEWLQIVETELSRTAIIYTSGYFFDDAFGTDAAYGARPLWVAHYTSKPAPRLPGSWKRHAFWQFTETGKLEGYNGPLDIDRFDGTEADLQKLVTGTSNLLDASGADEGMEMITRGLGLSGGVVKRVNASRVNFRSRPKVETSSFIVELPMATDVEVLAENINQKWAQVRTILNGQAVTGYVSQSYLRPRSSDDVEKLVSAAVVQWLRFNRGEGKETILPFRKFIGEMWQAIGLPYDGGDTKMFWSAAAISFFARNAGPAYKDFKFSRRHSDYIKDAIAKRIAKKAAPFWGYRLNEAKPAIGDIVASWRETKTDYDSAQSKDKFASHCDVVVEIHADHVITIGGNVGDSVSTDKYMLTGDGHLVNDGKLFCLLVNRNR